jgi:hypothetical protein
MEGNEMKSQVLEDALIFVELLYKDKGAIPLNIREAALEASIGLLKLSIALEETK